LNKKSLSQPNEKGLKFGQYQPDSLERANNNDADNNYVSVRVHISNLYKIKKAFLNRMRKA